MELGLAPEESAMLRATRIMIRVPEIGYEGSGLGLGRLRSVRIAGFKGVGFREIRSPSNLKPKAYE